MPPEPPPDLNNATLAGFDANGNGVRDDVERVVATKAVSRDGFDQAMAVARRYQGYITLPNFGQADFDAAVLGNVCFEYRSIRVPVGIGSPEIRTVTFNTSDRRSNWKNKALNLSSRATDAEHECN